jgi:hypothetical protein
LILLYASVVVVVVFFQIRENAGGTSELEDTLNRALEVALDRKTKKKKKKNTCFESLLFLVIFRYYCYYYYLFI